MHGAPLPALVQCLSWKVHCLTRHRHTAHACFSTLCACLYVLCASIRRYLLYGDVSFRVAEALRKPEVEGFFARLIQRVAPKSWDQAVAEVKVTRKFYENFSGDQVAMRQGCVCVCICAHMFMVAYKGCVQRLPECICNSVRCRHMCCAQYGPC